MKEAYRVNQKPNILLIQTDQQSAETLEMYGNPIVKTPNLERLAEKGFLFESAFCNYPACVPSRSSMMTGRYASTIRSHANYMFLNPDEVSLPEVLRENGYQTALVGKNHAFMDAIKQTIILIYLMEILMCSMKFLTMYGRVSMDIRWMDI